MAQKIKISVNEGPPTEVDTVRVFVEGCTVREDGDEVACEVHTNYTKEGVIVDVVADDDVIATTSHEHDEAAQNTFDRG